MTALTLKLRLCLAAAAACSSSLHAETFGPYFYRTGEEKSFSRAETIVETDGKSLKASECAQHMHGLVPEGERQCWTENVEAADVTRTASFLRWLSADVYAVDLVSKKSSITDAHDGARSHSRRCTGCCAVGHDAEVLEVSTAARRDTINAVALRKVSAWCRSRRRGPFGR